MTPRQRQVLVVVNDTIARTGVSPSAAELGKQLRISAAAVSTHLRALTEAGYLRRAGFGRAVRSLEVLRVPGQGLRAEEIAWCQANPERVRAMMALTGAEMQPVDAAKVAKAASGPALEAAVAEGRAMLDELRPGMSATVSLPREQALRERAYRRLSLIAIRRWGPGGCTRKSTPTGVLIRRAAP